jgi:site-specific DNA-methyltransferase (cytosine-N4-specific)
VIQADALILPIRSGSIDCIVTSPPYWAQREYGDSEIEVGKHDLRDYLNDMRRFLREADRVLKDDGVMWLNIGDKASGSGGAGGDWNKGGKRGEARRWKGGDSGLPPRQWCNVPARLATMAQSEGWLLRSEITWDKGRNRPEDPKHARRPLVASEKILLLAKAYPHPWFPEQIDYELGDVWHFPPVTGRENRHLAPFPPELPRRAIVASTQPGDLVLDPFAGSGTTITVAHELGRRAVGVDLYADSQCDVSSRLTATHTAQEKAA